MIKTLENASESQKKAINKVFGSSQASESDIKAVIKIMNNTSAVNYSKRLSMMLINKSKEILKRLKLDNYYESIFSEFSDYMFSRTL